MTDAHAFLKLAAGAMTERAKTRDAQSGERSMARAVAIFRAHTGIELSESDGWRFMLALKMAREIQGDYHPDDYTDLAGYAALLGECAGGAQGPGKNELWQPDIIPPGPAVFAPLRREA